MTRRGSRATALVSRRPPARLRDAPAPGLAAGRGFTATRAFTAAPGFTPPRGLAEPGFFGRRAATDPAALAASAGRPEPRDFGPRSVFAPPARPRASARAAGGATGVIRWVEGSMAGAGRTSGCTGSRPAHAAGPGRSPVS